MKTDLKHFIERLEYAKNLLDDASNGEQSRNSILAVVNIFEGSELGEPFQGFRDYAKEACNEGDLQCLCVRLSEELTETISSLKSYDQISQKKWWQFWK